MLSEEASIYFGVVQVSMHPYRQDGFPCAHKTSQEAGHLQNTYFSLILVPRPDAAYLAVRNHLPGLGGAIPIEVANPLHYEEVEDLGRVGILPIPITWTLNVIHQVSESAYHHHVPLPNDAT
jgi:hypothetical protein